jgi:hypothetical protein
LDFEGIVTGVRGGRTGENGEEMEKPKFDVQVVENASSMD